MRSAVIVLIVVLVAMLAIALTLHLRAPNEPAVPTALQEGPPLQQGDRVFVSGGYDMEPRWLSGRAGYAGTLERFIPGQNKEPAAVVRTDEPVTADEVTGNVLVMELRWVGATWRSGAVAHIELCNFEPDAVRWQDRRQGAWVQSHATIRHLE